MLPGPALPRWRILAWWLPLVATVTGYWAYSLLLLGRYEAPLAPYTAGAAVTTSVMSLSNTLRGTESLATYLVVNGHAWWPMGFWASGGIAVTIITGLLAGRGLTGLLAPRLRCAHLALRPGYRPAGRGDRIRERAWQPACACAAAPHERSAGTAAKPAGG